MEAGIKASDIVQRPNVLYIAIEKMKERIQELQLHGCPYNRILSIVYQPSKTYSRILISFKEKWVEQAVNEA